MRHMRRGRDESGNGAVMVCRWACAAGMEEAKCVKR